ncbi:MAG: AEC family transporter, partial [Desulfurivibrionaceae bacterium]
SLAGTLVPVVMIAVGFQLTVKISREALAPLGWGLFLKLVAAPLIALAGSRFLGLSGEAVDVAIFEAGMPPMVSAGALAILAGLAPSLTAALVGLGIILSFVTLPLLYYLLSL